MLRSGHFVNPIWGPRFGGQEGCGCTSMSPQNPSAPSATHRVFVPSVAWIARQEFLRTHLTGTRLGRDQRGNDGFTQNPQRCSRNGVSLFGLRISSATLPSRPGPYFSSTCTSASNPLDPFILLITIASNSAHHVSLSCSCACGFHFTRPLHSSTALWRARLTLRAGGLP